MATGVIMLTRNVLTLVKVSWPGSNFTEMLGHTSGNCIKFRLSANRLPTKTLHSLYCIWLVHNLIWPWNWIPISQQLVKKLNMPNGFANVYSICWIHRQLNAHLLHYKERNIRHQSTYINTLYNFQKFWFNCNKPSLCNFVQI